MVIFGVGLLATRLHGAFAYDPNDLLMGLRKVGAADDLTVNLGRVTNYLGFAPGTTITITNLSTNQLDAAFAGLDEVIWSAFSAVRTNTVPEFPESTLWVTAPRADINVPSDPWLRKGPISQGIPSSIVYSIGNSARLYGNAVPDGPNNTATGVVIPAGDAFSYSSLMGPNGNFQSSFQGDIENTTPFDFSTAGVVSRSDLYELKPGTTAAGTLNTPGTFIGYFDFSPSGTVTFTSAGGQTPTPPTITGVSRSGDVATISFNTVSGTTYSLVRTNSSGLGAPITTWTTVPGSVSGDGSTKSLQDSSTDPDRFYLVVATSGTSGAPQLAGRVAFPSVKSW